MTTPRISRPFHLTPRPRLSAQALALSGSLLLSVSSHGAVSTWTGGSGNWSSNLSPGWNGTGVPNAIGAVAQKTDSTTASVTQDVSGGVTVGTISFAGTTANSFTITPTNAITLNQDGAGSGFATISNVGTNVSPNYRVTIGTGTLTLADDLLISNTSGSTSTSGSISISSTIGGSGNVTLANVSNNTGAGQIGISGSNTFTGNVLIQKGAITYASNTAFGNSANGITLGSSGNGSTTLISTGTGTTVANNIIVASGSGGTLVLGSNNNGGTNTSQTYSGTLTLNGDLSVTSSNVGTGALKFTNTISGTGALTVIGGGKVLLSGTNTFSGTTRVSAGTLQLDAASGTNSLALQNSTLDLNGSDTGAVNFGSSTTTTITSATVGGLTGSRNLDLRNIATSPAAVALSVGNNNSDQSYSGQLTGSGSLTKIGTGKQTLSGTSTYTGTTSVNGGTLNLTGDITTSPTTTVNTTGTLIGTGAASALVLNNGGAIKPGTPAAVTGGLTASSLIWNAASASTLTFNLDGSTASSTSLTLSGALTKGTGSAFTLNFTQNGTLATPGIYNLINFGSTTFTQADVNLFTTNLNSLSYAPGFSGSLVLTGNQLNFLVVPEPGTWALLLGGLALLVLLPARRQKQQAP